MSVTGRPVATRGKSKNGFVNAHPEAAVMAKDTAPRALLLAPAVPPEPLVELLPCSDSV
jgi:hypothetical protein